MSHHIPVALLLLILFAGFRFPAAARLADSEVNRLLRSGLDTRTWHFGYDAATRLTSATLKNPAEAILKSHGWQYDPGDNRIASKTDSRGLIPTRHNNLNQLLSNGSGPIRFAGTIDEPGTVTVNGEDAKMRHHTLFEAYLELAPGTHEVEIAATDFSENTTTQSFEVEIANEPEAQLEYDSNGNLTTRTDASGITFYKWDALDRLITIIYPDASRSEFTYDGLSRRVRIIERNPSGTITSDKRHLWDDLQIAEERATDGTTVTKRFYPQGVELVTGPSAGDYTYRTDHQGSIREIVDSTGALTARYDYTAWGETELVSGAFDLDFRYTGHYFHQPSSLHLAPYRAYDAGLARWINRDPIAESGGINLYGYVQGNPLNLVDPLGLQCVPEPNSITTGITQAIATGNIPALQAGIAAGEGIVSPVALATGRAALARLQSTAQQVIAKECKGSVNKVFPRELLGKTYAEIVQAANRGNKAAQTAKKLLNDLRFKK